MANTLSNSGIVDGQVILASQVTQIVDAFTSTDAYDISISGSFTVVGQANITASNAISASYAPNLYNTDGILTDNRTIDANGNNIIFVVDGGETFTISSDPAGDVAIDGLTTGTRNFIVGVDTGNGKLYAMATSSIQNVVSSSYALTASYALNGGGGSIDTGSFYLSSSVNNAIITFTQGDSSIEQVIINNVESSSYALTASFAPGIRVDGLNDLSTATNVKVLGFTGVNMSQIDSETAVATIVSSSYAATASLAITATGVYKDTGPVVIGNAIGDISVDGLDTTVVNITALGNAVITGSLDVKGSITVSGSQVLTLEPVDPLPSGVPTGSFAVSASVPPRPYMWDGSAWYAL